MSEDKPFDNAGSDKLSWKRVSNPESTSESNSDSESNDSDNFRERRRDDSERSNRFERPERRERPERERGQRRERSDRDDRQSGPSDWIHGVHPIMEALKSGKDLERLLIKKGNDKVLRDLAKEATKAGIPVQDVPIEKLNRVTRKNHQGAIAFLSPITYSNLSNKVMEAFEEGRDPLVLLLDEVTDVGNFGAICRTAECSGVDAVVIPMKGRAQINAQAVKSSAGALLNISVCREKSLKQSLEYLKESGFRIVACTEKT
ncbi:MAG: 23S rRNA (guanosine2251-2'-O)-methyltransferase, partial [Bacteroidia bacterium]